MPAPEQSQTRSSPPRVLLLEDEWLIALDLQDILESSGYVVVGPAPTVGVALNLLLRAERDPIHAGLLDLHVGKETSYPVAEAMKSRGIPFAFLTGHAREDLKPEFRSVPLVCKPATVEVLLWRLNELVEPT